MGYKYHVYVSRYPYQGYWERDNGCRRVTANMFFIESELERFKKSIYELAKAAMKAAEITSTQLGISISHLLEVINNGTC